MSMNINLNHRNIAMDISETFQATSSIQLRTHPTHATINFSELGKKLLESARNGDTEDVLELINTGAPFTTDWLGASPLHYAAQYGHADTVETLLRSGIAKDARTKIDRTPLHVASQEGHLEAVNVLVNYGCDVDAKDMLKMTPLHWAVQRDHRNIMEVLLNHGADVNIANKFNKTPIDIAYTLNRPDEYVPLLQSYKGKAKAKVNCAETPMKMTNKTYQKNRSKSANLNRSQNKISQIKQEIEDDQRVTIRNNVEPNYKIIKRDSLSNGQPMTFNKQVNDKIINSPQNTLSNHNQMQNANKKIYTINNNQSPILVLTNDSTGSKTDVGNGSIKVINKKQVFTEIKNTKNIQDKYQIFNSKHGVVKRFVIKDQGNSPKDEEIRKLQDENNKLKRELEEFKSLIISKDLEIERLKKRFENHEK